MAVPIGVVDAAEGMLWVADNLAEFGIRLAMVLSDTEDARATLDEAAGLLLEDIDATEIVVADALSVAPTCDDPDPEATLSAAAKLVAVVFSDAPVLPGAIGVAMDLVASVYALPPSHTGTLQDARRILRTVTDDHDDASDHLVHCAPDLSIQQGGETWLAWSAQNDNASQQGMAAEMSLSSAIWQAQHAVLVHRLYQAQSRHRELARVAKQILSTAIEEVDAAAAAIRKMREAVAAEDQIVRKAIDAAAT